MVMKTETGMDEVVMVGVETVESKHGDQKMSVNQVSENVVQGNLGDGKITTKKTQSMKTVNKEGAGMKSQKMGNKMNSGHKMTVLEQMLWGFAANPDVLTLQQNLTAQYRRSTGTVPKGQLWQPCSVPGCNEEPVCMNCMRCQKTHCDCFKS